MNKQCYKCNLIIKAVDSWYGLHADCFLQWFNLAELERFQEIAAQNKQDSPLVAGIKNSTFFHGKFRKYSSTLGKTKYILKIREKEFPELPIVEYVSNQIFKTLDIQVPPFYLIAFEKTHSCFVTENFMGRFHESNLVHIYHYLPEKSKYDCENLVRIIGEKTGRITAQEDFVDLTLADSLIGNNDRHGRNLGFIQSSSGYEMAPFYDNTSYIGIEIAALLDADHQPKGAVATSMTTEPTMKDYVDEWYRLGFDYVVERFRKKISLDKIKKLIEESHLTEKRQAALLRIITKRNDELCQ